MHIKSITRFCVLFLWIGFFPDFSKAQEEKKEENRSFQFLAWPGIGSVLPAIDEERTDTLVSAWHEGLLISLAGEPLHIIPSKNDSLDKYLRVVLNSQPDCIEGDPGFITDVVNQQKILYVSILKEKDQDSTQNSLLQGEIIFLDNSVLWNGSLGVVHPDYSVGGKFQIDYWKTQTGHVPDFITFYSADEVLRHLFVGSIQAAAVPSGTLEEFLKKEKRTDIMDRFIRVHVPVTTSRPEIFLRWDHYTNLFMRTLVTETWLRDHFPLYFHLSPSIGF